MRDLPLAIERLLARSEPERRVGPFLLVRQLGRGGFAPVWLARETFGGETLRAAAVKIFALDARDRGASRRIIEEARALCRVEHPNVVRFYSLAVDEQLGVMGLGMEFVAGRSLATRLEFAGRMHTEQVVELGLAMASALSAVHRAGIVHRDVKPANIMETASGYKLVDFGIALAGVELPDVGTWVPSNDSDCTGRVAALQSGTLGYVDPFTIATGTPASPESDLYALGATLYECLTGCLPATSDVKTLDERILDGRSPPLPVAKHIHGISDALATIIDRMVSPDRTLRFASADELAQTLERLRNAPPSRRPPRALKVIAASIVAVASASLLGVWFAPRKSATLAVTIESASMTPEAEMRPAPAPSAGTSSQTEIHSAKSIEDLPTVRKPPLHRQKAAALRPSPPNVPSAITPAVVIAWEPTPMVSAMPPPTVPSSPSPTNSFKSKLLLPPARDW
jgi:serine/threonine protein kinase